MRAALARLAWAGLTLTLLFAAPALAAADEVPLAPEDMKLEVLDSAGNPEHRAGAQPDRFITRLASGAESAKSVEIEFPRGMGGDPSGAEVCSRAAFDDLSEALCPPGSQVGLMTIVRPQSGPESFPIYNLEPRPGEVVAFGAAPAFIRLKFSGRLDSGDFGMSTRVEGLPQSLPREEPVVETIFEFWGVPADHQVGTGIPRRPFLTLPTRCDRGPLAVTFHVAIWEHPGQIASGTTDAGAPLTGCGDLPFAPTVDLGLETPVADAPTGFSVDLRFPAGAGAGALASSQARAASIEFPAGMAISPGAASRLSACSDAQLARGSDAPASCPASSRVGTVEVGVPQLSEPLRGDVYLGQEHADERFRLFVVARSEAAGVEAKFVGTMRADPGSGRLTAVLGGLPEAALGNLLMRFDGGPRALFVAPDGCGPATVVATVTPYSGNAPVRSTDSVEIGPRPGRRCGEPAPFEPTLSATTSARRGGRPTSFAATIGRRDGDQLTDRFAIAFPPGLSAGLGAVELCPAEAIAAARCPAASRIGSAFVDAGAGPETAQLDGDAYLTGPYRGGPFGVALVFRAALGPFDFGTLTMRAAMRLDPLSGRVSVQSDSLPQSFQGIPIRLQTIGLVIDRPGFLRTPTSCGETAVGATVTSTAGAVAQRSAALGLSGCVGLRFRPVVAIALSDREQLHRLGRPGLRITLRSKPGEANLRSLAMRLPRALRFGAGGLREVCARRQALRGNCPAGARVGTGSARTALLSQPLRGAVYVVQPEGNGEPDLWVALRGRGIELNLRSVSEVEHGRLETRFPALPDMPLSSFTVRFAGGERGILTLQQGLCRGGEARRLSAAATLDGQNGARRQPRVAVTTPKVCRAG